MEREGTGAPGTQVTEMGLSPSCRPLLQPLPGAEGHFQQAGQHVQVQPSFPKQRTHTVPRGAPRSSRLTFCLHYSGQRDRSGSKTSPHPTKPPTASLPPRTSLEHPQRPTATSCPASPSRDSLLQHPLPMSRVPPRHGLPPTPGHDLPAHFLPHAFPSLLVGLGPQQPGPSSTPLTLKLGWVSWCEHLGSPAIGREAPPRQGRAGLTLSPVSGTEPGTE